MSSQTCRSTVELSMLASGMAKQHESYQDALQELVDNSVSSVVSSEAYFDDPDDAVEIVVTLVRDQETVRTIIADNGPGISRSDLREHVFRTGNKATSSGILNNVGWGLKASISWFERTLEQRDIDCEEHGFTLVTQTPSGEPNRVDGPITGELPIQDVTESAWAVGCGDDETSLKTVDHGTRLCVSCSREQFDDDVWPSADSLSIKAQLLRERFGVLFRRLLTANEDNSIKIVYRDLETGNKGSTEVVPIAPLYEDEESGEESSCHEFTIEDASGRVFDVEYEHGTLDLSAMVEKIGEDNPELLTTSGRFRYRYRPSQKKQGVDIYANGRVLMTSVFSDLFDLARNNQYNYFGGRLRIIPQNPAHEVPTDNKKTRIDTNSQLWQRIQDRLSEAEFQPEGKDYRGTAQGNSKANSTERDREAYYTGSKTQSPTRDSVRDLSDKGDIFGLHNTDARGLYAYLQSGVAGDTLDDLVDVAITSPPYFDLKDYGYDSDKQIGQQESYHEYLQNLRSVFHDLYRITNPSGSLWVIVNTFRKDQDLIQLPADIARVCQNIGGARDCPNCSTDDHTIPLRSDQLSGTLWCPNCDYTVDARDESWVLKDAIVWDKKRARPFTNHGQFRNIYEYVLCFGKNSNPSYDLDSIRIADPAEFKQWWVDYPERYHPRGMLPANIWQMKATDRGAFTEVDIDHPAPLPPKLIERILRLTTTSGDVVIDPFAGSGTVLAQATAMDRRAIGFELSEAFCDAYAKVEAEIHQEWVDKNIGKEGRQKRLTRINCGLRHIKHTREHLRQMARTLNVSVPAAMDIHTVFHIATETGYQAVDSISHGEADVIFVTDNGLSSQERAQYETVARDSADVRPCSGFGVRVNAEILSTETFCDRLVDNAYPQLEQTLYLYEDGRHYAYADEIDLRDWVQYVMSEDGWREMFANHNCQPIISNLKIDVNHPTHDLETHSRETSSNHEVTMFGADGSPVFAAELEDNR